MSVDQLTLLAGEWDNLIVMDACRSDYFEQIYSNFFTGELIKAISPATNTRDWLTTVFPDVYDHLYITSNVRVRNRSDGWPYWSLVDHFPNNICIWRQEDKIDPRFFVPFPVYVSQAAVSSGKTKGLILHYLQPHQPYIGKVEFDHSDVDPLENIERWRDAYCANLVLVLKEIAWVLPHLEGVTVITADHGEMLGEDGLKFHNRQSGVGTHPLLHEVPWLTVGESS